MKPLLRGRWGAPTAASSQSRPAVPGVLTFKAAPNFEAPGDADKDNVYEVTLSVADNNGNRGTKGVKVTVTDADEDGKVTLSKIQPRVGIAVKATLSDPDGNLSKLTWEWWSAPENTMVNGSTSQSQMASQIWASQIVQ